jgi:superfamily II DNA helicase RecQ
MVATTGFIHGIDHPGVDTVIFWEMPYGLSNFVQGAGQACHSGQVADIFLLNEAQTFIEPQAVGHDAIRVIPGNQYAHNTAACQQNILSDVMDGQQVSCQHLYDAVDCDLCNPDYPIVAASYM